VGTFLRQRVVACSNNNLFLLWYDCYYLSYMFVNLLDKYFVRFRVSSWTIFCLSVCLSSSFSCATILWWIKMYRLCAPLCEVRSECWGCQCCCLIICVLFCRYLLLFFVFTCHIFLSSCICCVGFENIILFSKISKCRVVGVHASPVIGTRPPLQPYLWSDTPGPPAS